MKSKNKILVIAILALFPLYLSAQVPGRLNFELFEKAHKQGVPGVYDMFQDSQGIIWLGSTNGIYRYNGTDILEFKGDEKKILGKTNYSFLEEHNGDVLIGSDYGVCRYRLKESKVELLLHLDRPFEERSKYCIMGYDRQHRLWLSIAGVGIAWYQNGKTELLKDPENTSGLKPDRARQGYIDTEKDLMYLPNYLSGSVVIDLKTLKIKQRDQFHASALKKIGQRLFKFYPGKIITKDAAGKENSYEVPDAYLKKTSSLYVKVTVQNDSCLWMSGMYGIVSFNYRQNRFTDCFGFESDAKSPALKLISELFTDRSGNTWVCSETDGIRLFNNFRQNRFQFANGATDMTIMDMEPVNDTLLLVCPLVKEPCLINLKTNTALAFFKEKTGSQTFGADKLNDSTCVLTSATGGAWLFHYRSLRLAPARCSDPKAGFLKLVVTGPDKGYLLDYSRVYRFRFLNGIFMVSEGTVIPSAFNFTLLHDPSNHLLIFSTRENSLMIDDSTLSVINTTAPLFGAFNGYSTAKDGSLWLATRQGLKHYNRGYRLLETFDSDNGLNNDVIYELLFNKDSSSLFVSTNRGISEIHLSSKTVRNYTTTDGIQESEHNTGACAKGPGNTFYFGNIHGVTFFKEQNLRTRSQAPFLVIQTILVNDTNYQKNTNPQFTEGLILRPGDSKLSLRYSLLQSSEQESVLYRYQLEGLDRNWQVSAEQPVINYSGLEPGDYTLKLSGCVEGQCTQKNIHITVMPPYYRTWWFLLLAIITGIISFIFLASVIAKARVRRKEKKLETERRVLEEKTRISRDLHDNVGARLSMMINTMDWITKTKTFDESVMSELQDNTRSVIQNLRETIWVMNRQEITAVELFDKIKNYALLFFRHHPTKLNFDERITEDRTFNSEQTLNLFRITQEVLNNTLKYAKADTVDIAIITHPEAHLEINFSDNGVGFDMGDYEAGNGIINMKERAEEIRAEFFIESAVGRGTMVRIELYSK